MSRTRPVRVGILHQGESLFTLFDAELPEVLTHCLRRIDLVACACAISDARPIMETYAGELNCPEGAVANSCGALACGSPFSLTAI